MLLSWSTDESKLQPLQDTFGDTIPTGSSELVLPVVRLGSGVQLPFAESTILNLGLDTDVRFDGLRTYAINTGDISFHPRMGAELDFRGVVALRAGVADVSHSEALGLQFAPTVGAGLIVKQVQLDYGFGNFAGAANELGFSHRVSFVLTLEQPSLKRADR